MSDDVDICHAAHHRHGGIPHSAFKPSGICLERERERERERRGGGGGGSGWVR